MYLKIMMKFFKFLQVENMKFFAFEFKETSQKLIVIFQHKI